MEDSIFSQVSIDNYDRVSLSSRRPNMLRYNRWVGECLDSLANNPNASQTDKYLVSWIRLIRISEEIGLALGFEDVSSMANLSEPRTQIVMSGLQKTLQSWKVLVGSDVNGMCRLFIGAIADVSQMH